MAFTLSNPSSNLGNHSHELTAALALRYAWISYIVLLFCPFFLFIAVLWYAMEGTAQAHAGAANAWFLVSMVYLAVVVPTAIFWRSHLFKAYWRGDTVLPSAYLTGMLTVWITLEIGGILSLIGCLVGGQLMPGLVPAAVALVLFTPLWPSGRAMVRHVGNADDPETYSEPR